MPVTVVPTSFATVAIDTFITELSSVMRNCADASVSRTVPDAVAARDVVSVTRVAERRARERGQARYCTESRKAIASPAIPAAVSIGTIATAVKLSHGVNGAVVRASVDVRRQAGYSAVVTGEPHPSR